MLTSHEFDRYHRQLNLAQVGIDGQSKLKHARVLCVGAGGLGSPLLVYLAAAGVGTIGIIDNDQVELNNLPRQIIYADADVGQLKTEIAQQKLKTLNPNISIQIYSQRFNGDDAQELFIQYDIIADCSDNFATRYLINDICYQLGKPYVFASIFQFEGQCATFLGKKSPCFRCIFPSKPPSDIALDCNAGGVLGVVPGILGMIQATEILKWILQKGELLTGRLLTVDLLKMQFREYEFTTNPDCEICGKYRKMTATLPKEKRFDEMNAYLISPQELKEALENKEYIQLIDVRTLDKHQAFNIGGKHIPLEELPQRLNELNPNTKVVTYCTMGGKSMMALQFLLSAGFKSVQSLDGGMTAWQKARLD